MTSFRRAMVLSVMWSTSVAAVEWTELSSESDTVVLDDGSAVSFVYTLTVSGSVATWRQLWSAGDVPAGRYGHTVTVLSCSEGTAAVTT